MHLDDIGPGQEGVLSILRILRNIQKGIQAFAKAPSFGQIYRLTGQLDGTITQDDIAPCLRQRIVRTFNACLEMVGENSPPAGSIYYGITADNDFSGRCIDGYCLFGGAVHRGFFIRIRLILDEPEIACIHFTIIDHSITGRCHEAVVCKVDPASGTRSEE